MKFLIVTGFFLLNLQSQASLASQLYCAYLQDKRVILIDLHLKVAEVIESDQKIRLAYVGTDAGDLTFQSENYILDYTPRPGATRGVGLINLGDHTGNTTMWCQNLNK